MARMETCLWRLPVTVAVALPVKGGFPLSASIHECFRFKDCRCYWSLTLEKHFSHCESA